MNFSSTYTFTSKAFPEVTVTLRRMGPKRRAEVELSVAGPRAKRRDLSYRIVDLNSKIQAELDTIPGFRDAVAALPKDDNGNLGDLPANVIAMMTPEVWAITREKNTVEDEAASIDRAQINPAFLNAAIKSFDGITREDGKPFDVQTLCDDGPESLFDELVAAVFQNAYLPQDQAANLSSPTTSGAQEDGGQTSSIAQSAS